jgi:hypothetical protein
MKLHEFKTSLSLHPDANLRFILPNGQAVPAHAHVTEVAQITKRFIDCGGTRRDDVLCRLQTWVAEDFDHRLTARKLLGILNQAAIDVLTTDDLELDVEHEVQYISQFPVALVEFLEGELRIKLGERHTACLAQEKCLPSPPTTAISFKKPSLVR